MKPRILDLFAGAGGAAVGYARAGFEVVGVDIAPQPNYPFEFHQADALHYLEIPNLRDYFDAIHASPPCQFGTTLQSMPNARQHPNLIPETRELLEATGLPYVIENVSGAKQHLRSPFKLCGSMFGLGVDVGDTYRELRRHRYFETNWSVDALMPQCHHRFVACGIYGDHFRMGRRSSDGEFSGLVGLHYGQRAMGIDWMTWPELTEAIPPAYTAHIGHQLLAHVQRTAA